MTAGVLPTEAVLLSPLLVAPLSRTVSQSEAACIARWTTGAICPKQQLSDRRRTRWGADGNQRVRPLRNVPTPQQGVWLAIVPFTFHLDRSQKVGGLLGPHDGRNLMPLTLTRHEAVW